MDILVIRGKRWLWWWYAHISDVILLLWSRKQFQNSPLEWSEVIKNKTVIVYTYKEFKCDNGMIIGYDYNATIVIVQEGNPKGTWIFVAIGREVR